MIEGVKETKVIWHAYDSSRTTSMKSLKQRDRDAARAIEDAKDLIREAKAYRLSLADRARELQEMRFHARATLKREKNIWTGKISYTLLTEKVYEDGTAETLERSTFEGRERHKAIAEFKALKKEFPGYEFVEDTQKARWER